jgi:starch phosphorylase
VGPSTPITPSAREVLAEQLPGPLQPLASLAFNYWWSWQPEGEELWRSIDPERWVGCSGNPVRFLRECSRRRLDEVSRDGATLARMDRLRRGLDDALAAPPVDTPPATASAPVAFLCAEYAVHASLPIYSGGLGALAGDILKEASDRRIPLVAVGLLYRRGYFHQRLDPSGWQHEYWTVATPEQLPLERVEGDDGAPLVIEVPVRRRSVRAAVWRVDVGRVPLYLLDSDLPDNSSIERFITSQLYVRDRSCRLMQYTLLGIGAVRALSAMHLSPALWHLNEGHAAASTLELARCALAAGAPLEEALRSARDRTIFTTHTPVAAGNESYSADDVQETLGGLLHELSPDPEPVLALGRGAGTEGFGLTVLALRMSRAANAVSRRHGEVARAMWSQLWPERLVAEVPIVHVTNGVHLPTWMANPMRALLDRHLDPGWLEHPADPWRWAGIGAIPDAELWAVRNRLRAELVEFVRTRSVADRLARGEPIDYVEQAALKFDPQVLTVGFARRVASYKRLHLLVASTARALALLAGPRPIQVVIAGKAHPADDGAKRMVQSIFALKHQPLAGARVAFLEDYDLDMARKIVAGCDVWVNLPRPPLEASGTSGMKAMLNGALNLSVLDGWWSEGFQGTNGWAIRSEPGPDEAIQDARDADALYCLLEQEVVPLFHERDALGIPAGWVQHIKTSLRSLGPTFNTARTLSDYLVQMYPSTTR